MKAKIEDLLQKAFKPIVLEVIDESYKHAGHAGASQGGHYLVYIVSDAFVGKRALDRHRMVFAAVEPIKSAIHALSIKAKTVSES